MLLVESLLPTLDLTRSGLNITVTFEDAPYISPSLFLPYLSSINNDHLLPLQHSAVLSLALTLTVTLALTWRLQSQPTPYKDNVHHPGQTSGRQVIRRYHLVVNFLLNKVTGT